MNIQSHKNARTTPAIRLELQSQPESVSDRELAEAYHLNRHAVAKWHQREGVEDASHHPQRLHATLSTAQERWWWRCVRPSRCPWMTCWR